MKNVGKKIKIAMAERDLTQFELANKLGIKQAAISKLVRGINNLSLGNLEKIAKATGKPLNFFLNDSIGGIKGSNFSINTVGKGNINTSKDMELLKKEIELLKKELEIVKKEKELMKNRDERCKINKRRLG
jgi:transcriptional regulator with XRE-family HTH domain